MIKYVDFEGVNGYKTIENAKKAIEKKLAGIDRIIRVTIVVNNEGRFVPAVLAGNDPDNFHLIHQGICILG